MIPTAEEFVRLRTSEKSEEYLRAAHDDAPIEVWRDVIAKFPEMKKWVAHNKSVPLEILRELATDADPEVRRCVASKRKLDRALFELLCRDEHTSVRSDIVGNPKVPKDVLATLCTDPNSFVQETAKRLMSKRFPID